MIYHIEHPFFERYKCNENAWPWNEDRTKWNVLMRKAVCLTMFNTYILTSIIYLALDSCQLIQPQELSMEKIPSVA